MSEAVAAGPGTTVAVVNIGALTDDQRAALARSGADITVVGALTSRRRYCGT